ncbi:PQQ-binding-like beta-propeller repeat protein [Prosthecobacter debontii]|uniref:PQQ-binding-like beta-propeller repeat protein n=1 Tax=Prosthecobacter debontii TaxID=48467 RepID=UPI001591D92C|nr:PQQ-binding-like beta-propeller repeat protein [Prosthecobacter debontii]
MKIASLLPLFFLSAVSAADWPRFLGPTGAAAVSGAEIPLTWSASQNMAWKYTSPGPGSSSPIVVGDKVLFTSWSGYGDKEGADDPSKLQRHLVCLNLADGSRVWEAIVASAAREDLYEGFLAEHGYATHTPVSDGESVYAFFGKSGAYAFDLQTGKQLWHTPLGTGSGSRRWGSGGSPILVGDRLIVNATDESKALFALEKKTGQKLWEAGGDVIDLAYSTPALIEHEGRADLVFPLANEVWGMNPETGKLRWLARYELPGNVTPVPVYDQEKVYLFGGFPTQGSVAIKLGGQGDVTETHTVWKSKTSTYVPTPVLYQGHLYVVNDQGFALCIDAKTGEDVFRERVIDSGGGRGRGKPFYASPVLVGDRLYAVSRRGGTYVIAAKPTFEKLAHNVIADDDSQFHGTPAVAAGNLILRSDRAVYCIRQAK